MSLIVVKRIKIPYRQKEVLYPLIIISGDPISYSNRIIHFKMELLYIKLKRQIIEVSFNILPLGKDKAVLRMPFFTRI